MSDNIPFELQVQIVKWLPVKSLLQFRSVSKDWKHLIDSPTFTAQYNSLNHRKLQHLLVRYDYNDAPIDNEQKYISVVDDDSFPKHKTSLTVPQSVKMLKNSSVIGSYQGLVCLFGDYRSCRSELGKAVIWNPSVRKSVSVTVPNAEHQIQIHLNVQPCLGFGVCSETNDPKIVKITYIQSFKSSLMFLRSVGYIDDDVDDDDDDDVDDEDDDDVDDDDEDDDESTSKLTKYVLGRVEVFKLSTGVWRNQRTNLPRKSVRIGDSKEALDGFIYWLANDGEHATNLIISFDMTSEEFNEVVLPDSLAHNFEYNLSMSKLIRSLVVLETDVWAADRFYSVWMMEDSAKKHFTKLYTINTTYTRVNVSCFRRTDEPILKVVDDSNGVTGELVVYDPGSKRISNLGIKGDDVLFSAYPYMETLHLHLLQPAFISSDKGKQNNSKSSGKKRRPYK